MTIEEYPGAHRDLYWSFRIADDSVDLLDAYIDSGRVWVARAADGTVAGHVQLVRRDAEVCEVTNMAVAESYRGRGVGRALLERAVSEATRSGVSRLVLATGTADVGLLRFYQRCGFRMTDVVRDVFTEANGYPPGLTVDGIPLHDQVWFERRV
ncbi:GNAT family N-acetyltransferase [Nocardioides sp. LMS-CY]|uniref:GNAT family N-acetyltransferase n=1 Tax=Nocardioides sp. (strain LMS-CY) TaxID=2840457 RepID=UPI001C004B77|nr:GNAT family N-acetyltransferase [Nocardioides sp. LMS-CY]QWF22389.1 GNAT family N-acetyltransferase [Nocardioides sp. LMS-CY]